MLSSPSVLGAHVETHDWKEMIMLRVLKLAVVLGVTALVLCSCSHALTISNLEEYETIPSAPFPKPITVGLKPSSDIGPVNIKYATAIADALKGSSSIERVVYPYDKSVHGEVDVVSEVSIQVEYFGGAENFFINFPGFLIWAPAIFGYGYTAEIHTTVGITRSKDKAFQKLSVPTIYNFRMAEIDRTWTEIGWFEVGIIPFIGGFFFTGYDPDATGDFIREVSPNYGTYVTSKMLEAISSLKEQ